MADNKNNLEDFFKKRINDFDNSNDGWDLPDESAWVNAQVHFPNALSKKTWNWKLGALIFLTIALVSAGGYIFYLKTNLTEKSDEIDIVKNELENKNNTITTLEKEVFKVKSELQKEKLNTQIANTSLTQEKQITIQTILNQKRTIQNMQNEKNVLYEEKYSPESNLVPKKEVKFSQKNNSNLNTLGLKSNEILENAIPIAVSFSAIQNNFPVQKLDIKSEYKVLIPKQKKRKRKLEVGVSYTSLNFEIPIAYDFEKLEKEDFGKKSEYFSSHFKGGKFHLAYEIQPNLWITTGLRRTTGGFKKSFTDKLIYDKSGEFIDDEGKTINEFDITTQTGFSDGGSSIDFEIPDGTTINNGDFLITEWYYSQEYKFTQIPIGVNYFFGKNKFKFFLTGGLGWNKISLGESFVEAQLTYDNEVLPINGNEENKKEEVSSQFINGFLGAGLNYRLTSNWNIRTSFSLEKNFLQKSEIYGSTSFIKAFDLGLYYRF